MFTRRIRIDGKLTTTSNLHLGSGLTAPARAGLKITEGKRKGTDPDIAAVALAHNGQPYLPGTSLKGVLRAWLEEHGLGKEIQNLFGFEDKDDEARSRGGTAEFHDAFVDDSSQPPANHIPYWDAHRLTGVTASAAIDRYTRTAADQRLFHREYVPAGVTFNISITGQDLSEIDVALLLTALRAFNGGDPVALGSDTADGWGRFKWEDETMRVLDRADLPEWLANGKCGYEGLTPAPISATIEETITSRNHKDGNSSIPIELSIAFSGPFLINDPSRTHKESDAAKTKPNHAPRIGPDAKPLLPASALRGVLRSRAERIARTLGVTCCDPNSRDACKFQLAANENAADKIGNLCIPCRLFGAPGWASRIGFSAIALANEPRKFEQELVAIDRFTGGVAGSAKFDAHAFWQPHFDCTLRVDAQYDQASLGLLALALRDLEEGDLTIGFGAAKGYGACTAEMKWPDAEARNAAITALRALAEPHEEPSSAKPETLQATELPLPATQGNDAFFNPYHFVPSKPGERKTDVSRKDFEAKTIARLGHDRDADGTLSGRILCRLKTVTPVVIGGKQEPMPGNYTEVEPFRVPTAASAQEHDEIAIPATTLRGLLSSVAEAASNSALRVLEDESYSYRCAMDQSLQAIGEIVGNKIRPLTLPALSGIGGATRFAVLPKYARMFSPDRYTLNDSFPLKAYVDGYSKIEQRDEAPKVAVRRPSFLADGDPISHSADNREQFWYAKLAGSPNLQGQAIVETAGCKIKPGNASFLLGNSLIGDPISSAQWEADGRSSDYVRGILRVLGIKDREKEIPTSKHHEIFIPYPEAIEKTPLFDAADAIETFETLAKERTTLQKTELKKATGEKRKNIALPYSVKGAKRNTGEDGDNLRLRDGDLVFFEPSEDGTKVSRLAVSSIWRNRVEGSTHRFFERLSSDLLPFNPARKWLTIAEQMFGFVENKKPKGTAAAVEEKQDQPALALAGRVVVSFGRLADPGTDPLMAKTPLKILSSPKPPSPNLYFKRNGDARYIAKRELGVATHAPQGRKFYLHQPAANEPWKTKATGDDKAKDQKAMVQPIREETSFYFHVDFENLSETELGLLCYALAPSPTFHHKLGMGKPLGLGTVAIETEAIFLTARRSRYASDGSSDPRYHRKWLRDNEAPSSWPDRYKVERQCAANSDVISDATSAHHYASTFRATMDADIGRALEILGDPKFVTDPVHTPQLAENNDLEDKTYAWFGKNDFKGRDAIPLPNRQYLAPLTATSDSLPPLYRTFDRPFRPIQRQPAPSPGQHRSQKPAEPIVKIAAPPPPPIAPTPPARPIPPAVTAGETTTLRLRVRCEKRNGGTFYVVEDARVGKLQRIAKGIEGGVTRYLGEGAGREADVTLKADVALHWRLDTITIPR
jgi:CRISPR-associated protein (TIGR03986 family)